MPDSCSRILASIRRSLASARLPTASPATDHASVVTRREPLPTDHGSLISQFAEELRKLDGLFIAERLEKIPALLAQLLRERQAEDVLAWQAESLPVPGLLDSLRREGFKLPGAEVPPEEPARSKRLAELEQIKVGLTGVEAALADTATLALRSGPGRPRLASLSVRSHIALFTPQQLYPSWAAWWSVQPDLANWVRGGSNLTLITGPSRTGDIEMTLTVGVHGPAEVIAVFVQA